MVSFTRRIYTKICATTNVYLSVRVRNLRIYKMVVSCVYGNNIIFFFKVDLSMDLSPAILYVVLRTNQVTSTT